MVAFAKSKDGGTILAGITETTGPNGTQVGTVSGCDVSDGAILQIMNKASSCMPPVVVNVYIENTDDKPILRIYVPEGENKPHCTSKGIYCRRDGNRNRPLHPSEPLRIFLDNEGRIFAERFEQSAARITNDLASLESSLESSIDSMASKLGWAEYQLDDTESLLGSINSKISVMSENVTDLSTRIRLLFQQDKREDPIRTKAKKDLTESIMTYFKANPSFASKLKNGDKLTMTYPSKIAQELTQEEIESSLHDAVSAIKGELEETKQQPPQRSTPKKKK